jgi:hypothetical protein
MPRPVRLEITVTAELHSLVSAVAELDAEDLIRFLRALSIELSRTSGTHDEIGIRPAEIVKTYG